MFELDDFYHKGLRGLYTEDSKRIKSLSDDT